MFVFYDDVQYDRDGWRNRNRIKTPKGWQWLTVPVLHTGKFGQQICETGIDDSRNWQKDHFKTIKQYYCKAPYFKQYIDRFGLFYTPSYDTIDKVAEQSTRMLSTMLGMSKHFTYSSALNIPDTENKSERLLKICQHFGAKRYYSGAAAVGYLDRQLFEDNGIKVEFQDYHHPVYPQLHGEFISHLSVIDLLFMCGTDSLKILLGAKK